MQCATITATESRSKRKSNLVNLVFKSIIVIKALDEILRQSVKYSTHIYLQHYDNIMRIRYFSNAKETTDGMW